MPQEIKIPELGESIQEVQVVAWLKQEGQWVAKDEDLVELESEKATVRLPAPVAGVVGRIVKGDGQAAEVGEVIGYLDPMTEPQDSGRQAEEPRRTHDGKTPPPLRGESGAASPARTPEKRSESPASAMPSGEGRAETAEAAVSPATRRAGRVPQPPRAAREPVASAAPLRREEAVPMSAIR